MTDASKELFGDSVRFAELGGLAQMGDATGNPMVLTMSIWDDVGFLLCSPPVTSSKRNIKK